MKLNAVSGTSSTRPASGSPIQDLAIDAGSTRFLVDETYLLEQTERLGGELLDPIKTTVVQDQRCCMTTWVLRKHALRGGFA